MLGIFSLLPLMKGWDYKTKTWTREINRGQVIEVERTDETGWLTFLILATDDVYGGCKITFQGADLGSTDIGDFNPKSMLDYGATAQDPAGWIQRAYQPNPLSTAGAFIVVATSMGFQGSTFPYVPTTIVNLYLQSQSTQAKATVSLTSVRVIITNKKQFVRSLRAVMGMPTIQDIDPALLVAGTQEITQKGEFDEKKEEK